MANIELLCLYPDSTRHNLGPGIIRTINEYPCFKPNLDKIRAVLTLNYDWYLEGGATQKFQVVKEHAFKPVTRKVSTIGEQCLPVYHIHGYMPYNIKRCVAKSAFRDKKLVLKLLEKKVIGNDRGNLDYAYFEDTIANEDQLRKRLSKKGINETEPILAIWQHSTKKEMLGEPVLTKTQYESAYSTEESFLRQTLDCFLPQHTTIFIGISFDDMYFLKRLKCLAGKRRHGVNHYALLNKRNVSDKLINQLKAACIKPIFYRGHEFIPTILGKIYQAGLDDNSCALLKDNGIFRESSGQMKADYWALLLYNK